MVLWIFLTGVAKADNEPANNAPGTTTDVLSMGGSQSGQTGPGDGNDFYQLSSGADGNITISLINTNNEYAYITLYNSDGGTTIGSTQGYGQSGISFTANGVAAGNYYVLIFSTGLQNYSVSASLAQPPQSNDVEPNNTPATALSYTVGSNATGHIVYYGNGNVYDNNDYYVFTTTTDGDITVSLSNDNNNYLYLYLYDSDGNTTLGTTQGYPQSGIGFTATGLAAGTYYMHVFGTAGAYSSYSLSATLNANTLPNDGVFNNYFSTAPSFAQNDSIKGHIAYRSNGGSYDNYDYFSFYSNGDYDITISLTNINNQYTYIDLYDTDTMTNLGSTQGYAQNGISFTTAGLAAGTYYIRVFATNGAYSGYTLKNSYTVNPLANDVEPNNTPAQAVATSYNSTSTGHIAYRQIGGSYDNYDYYVFTTPADGNINLSLTNNNNNYVYLYLYDSDGATTLATTQGYSQGGISCNANGLAAGTYYAMVFTTNGAYSGYTLSKSFTPTPNTNDAEPNSDIATALPFNPNSTLTGHIAHRSNGGAYDNFDYYKIVTTADGNISLNFANDNNNYAYIYLYDNDGATTLATAQGYSQAGISCSASGLAAGTYYVAVYAGIGAYSGYTLSNTFSIAPFNNDVEANNSFATAALLNNNASKQGHIAYRFNGGAYDNYDYWKVTMLQTDSMRLDLTMATNAYSYIYFYDAAQSQLYTSQGYNTSYSVFFNSLPAGDYYLMIYAGTGAFNSYSIDHFYYPCNTSASAITAGGSTTFCQPGSVALNSVSAYASYLWSSGATTGSINATSSGTYTLTASDNDACPHTSNSINVNAVPAPTPSITPQSSTTFCAGVSVTLDAGSYSSYAWSTGETSQSINVSTAGTFTVTVTDATGCSGTSSSVSTTVNPLPTPSITPDGPTTFCIGGSVTLDAGAYSAYTWSNGATSQTINVSANGTFTVAVTDANGCSGNSAPVTVTVTSTGTPTISPSGATTFCAGGSVTLTATAGSSYLWSNAETTQSIVVSSNGTFTVDVTGAGGCSGTSNPVTVTVSSLPTPSITPNGPTTFCAGGSVTLDAGVYSSYAWSTGATVQLINVTSNGIFTVTVTDANGCSGVSGPLGVTVNPLPIVTLGSFADVCDNASAFALTGGSPAGGTYSGPGVSGGNFNPSVAGVGTHTITYSYTDGNGCPNSATSSINVTSCGGCNVTQANAGADMLVCSSNTVTLNGNTPSVGTGNWTVISSSGGVIAQHGNPNSQFSGIYNRTYILQWTISSPGCPSTTDEVRVFFMNNAYTVPKPAKINGPSGAVCGTTQTYSVPAINVFATYTWSGWPVGTIINTQSGNSINVTFPTSGVGTFHINVYATMCSKNSAVAALVVKGEPSQQPVTGPTVVCANTNGVVFSIPVVAGVNYNWKVPTGSSIVSGQGTHLVHVNWGANGGKVSCTISNGCGNSTCNLTVTTNCREQGVAIQAQVENSISVYPNPSSGVFTLQLSGRNGQDAFITVSDLQGRVIMQKIFSNENNSIEIDLSSYQSGMYLLEIKSESYFYTTRLIKKD